MYRRIVSAAAALLVSLSCPALARDIVDAAGRTVAVPDRVSRVICSGSGSLRLLTYLQAEEMAVAVDDMETRRQKFDARPYALATPRFKTLPVFGEFRGFDHPERILTLDPQPDVILKTVATGAGIDSAELQDKTGLPVVTIDFGDLGKGRDRLYTALRMMGEIVDRKERAEKVIAFFEERIADLKRRSKTDGASPPTAYIGGIAHKGPHGFQATEPGYPPFEFVGLRNTAKGDGLTGNLSHADVAKEMIVQWNPDFLFLDLSTLQLGDKQGGLFELRTDPAYRSLSAVKAGRVYGVLPYNWYSQNFGSILANAYYIGSLVHPETFKDIDPAAEADAIYTFLVGKPVFPAMNAAFGNLAYAAVPMQ